MIYKTIFVTMPLFVTLHSMPACSASDMETNTQSFSVQLGASRIIYDPTSNGTTLTITNPQSYPMLVQSQAFAEDMKTRAPFVVTPPLMRLDGLQQSRLRIIRVGDAFAGDRETLQWLCVKGIPPKAEDEWAKGEGGNASNKVSMNLQVSINNCIKLFVRPNSVKGSPEDSAERAEWKINAGKLKGENHSAYYMNISSLMIDSKEVKMPGYIPPFSAKEFTIPGGDNGKQVQWKIINDYGGESRVYKTDLK